MIGIRQGEKVYVSIAGVISFSKGNEWLTSSHHSHDRNMAIANGDVRLNGIGAQLVEKHQSRMEHQYTILIQHKTGAVVRPLTASRLKPSFFGFSSFLLDVAAFRCQKRTLSIIILKSVSGSWFKSSGLFITTVVNTLVGKCGVVWASHCAPERLTTRTALKILGRCP